MTVDAHGDVCKFDGFCWELKASSWIIPGLDKLLVVELYVWQLPYETFFQSAYPVVESRNSFITWWLWWNWNWPSGVGKISPLGNQNLSSSWGSLTVMVKSFYIWRVVYLEGIFGEFLCKIFLLAPSIFMVFGGDPNRGKTVYLFCSEYHLQFASLKRETDRQTDHNHFKGCKSRCRAWTNPFPCLMEKWELDLALQIIAVWNSDTSFFFPQMLWQESKEIPILCDPPNFSWGPLEENCWATFPKGNFHYKVGAS